MTQVLVKVCGLKTAENALACASAGADWIGLNFHPASPRSISPDRGAEIARALSGRAEVVGLFVNRPIAEVVVITRSLGLDFIQLHGDESPEYVRDLGPDLRVVRAYRLFDAASLARMVADLARLEALGCPPHAILVDAHVPGQPGGTGQSIAPEILHQLPEHPRLILAGGLNPSNVADRVALARPWMVDVASGVESSPGVKDPEKVRRFVDEARFLARDTSG